MSCVLVEILIVTNYNFNVLLADVLLLDSLLDHFSPSFLVTSPIRRVITIDCSFIASLLAQFLSNLGLSIPHDLLLISRLIFTDYVFVLLVLTHGCILLVYQRRQRYLWITNAVLLQTGWAAMIMNLISFILEDLFLSL